MNLFYSGVQRQRDRDGAAAMWRQLEKVLEWQAFTIRSENAYNLARMGAERDVVDKDEIPADYYEFFSRKKPFFENLEKYFS